MNTALETPTQELTEEKARLLLESGVHYGQPTSKRSPKMDEFVFGVSQNGMQIIDLNQTWLKLQEAGQLLQKLASEDKNVVFVGTNERAVSTVIQEYAEKYDLHNITSRWLGGTLTNPVTRNRINYLRELEGMEQSGLLESISAKEKSFLSKKLKKLRKNLGGLKKIKGAMHAMVIVDPVYEVNATLEALKKARNLTIIAVADTNCHFSPDLFDITIPCNTSSLRSLRVVMDELVKYIETGRQNQAQRNSISAGPSRKTGSSPVNKGPRKPSPIKLQPREGNANTQQVEEKAENNNAPTKTKEGEENVNN
ncbi:MAG: 30S ribosomal protein S2 [Candidatus Caenarcaniphilales bacterium]|nr:30S ribosomal protein S2 [Candidatus Caenarcaniphilales bacterium]